MKLKINLVVGAAAALAVSALPFNFESVGLGSFELSSAFAKNDNGGGKGKGGDHGGGKGKSGEHGKSGDAGSRGKSGGFGLNAPGRLKTIFSQETHGAKGNAKSKKSTDTKLAKASRKSARAVEVAALPETALIPEIKPKEEKLNARLAGLNSLKRNYHAYLNSQSPRMASIRAFVMASAKLDIANEDVSAAQAEFDAALADAGLTPYDNAVGVYDDPTLVDLQDRLHELENATVAPEDLQAWEAEKTALTSLLDSAEAEALEAAEDEAELAAVGTDDEALRQALLDAANKNRVAQYGDDYINEDVMDWAKDVLGVGDAYGKIDQVRETIATDSQ